MTGDSDEAAVQPAERWAELILVGPDGAVIGRLPPVPAGTQWWPEVETVVRAVRERHGCDVTILRLLTAERPRMPGSGGSVTYLAEVAAPVACAPSAAVLHDHPLRTHYAKPGGPKADLDWARSVLALHGLVATAPAVQIKTWNLSSLWRIPVGADDVWLKAVPHFFRHEGALIDALSAGGHVPQLLGFEPGRLLMRAIPGEDLWDATLDQRYAMIDLLVGLQRAWTPRVDELLALGVADWRAPALIPAIAAVFERTRHELSTADARAVAQFIHGLDARFTSIDRCGIPDSLVHGDFHAGNVRGHSGNARGLSEDPRGGAAQLTMLDWGDAGVGQPLLDQRACVDRAPPPLRSALRDHWEAQWHGVYPACDPTRAWDLLAPVEAARGAVVYRMFLDNIEPSEHPYHRDDPREQLQRVAAIVRLEDD